MRNAAGWLVFVIEKTKEQSTNLCAAPYKSRSFSILYLLYTHSVINSRIFSENEKSGMEHRCAPLPTKAIAFQFCFYYILILRNCQSIHIYRTVQRDRQIGQRKRMVTTTFLKIINDLANDAVIRDGPQRNHAVLVLVSIGRIRRWTPNIENVKIPVIVDCYV